MKEIIKRMIERAEKTKDQQLIEDIRDIIEELACTYNAPLNWRSIAGELIEEYPENSWVNDELELYEYH